MLLFHFPNTVHSVLMHTVLIRRDSDCTGQGCFILEETDEVQQHDSHISSAAMTRVHRRLLYLTSTVREAVTQSENKASSAFTIKVTFSPWYTILNESSSSRLEMHLLLSCQIVALGRLWCLQAWLRTEILFWQFAQHLKLIRHG